MKLRSSVRPIVILYCTFILGVLVILEAIGGTAPSSEISKEIIYAFIGITVAMDLEYAGERAVRHFKADKAKANKEHNR